MNKLMRSAPLFLLLVCIVNQCFAASRFPEGGISQTFNTGGHQKAKGLELSVDFPSSWKVEEARRPNTVMLATSENGLGTSSCALVINSLEQAGFTDESARVETTATLAERQRLEAVAESMGGRLIDGGGANLEGLPSRWLLVESVYSRDGSPTSYYLANWQLLFSKWFVSLTCGIGAASKQEVEIKLKNMLPTFRLIANSILIPTRWK
jgi:hypothetical protein